MRRLLVCLSLLLLASCASETEELPPVPLPSDPQPATLKEGLAVRYIGAKLNSVAELSRASIIEAR